MVKGTTGACSGPGQVHQVRHNATPGGQPSHEKQRTLFVCGETKGHATLFISSPRLVPPSSLVPCPALALSPSSPRPAVRGARAPDTTASHPQDSSLTRQSASPHRCRTHAAAMQHVVHVVVAAPVHHWRHLVSMRVSTTTGLPSRLPPVVIQSTFSSYLHPAIPGSPWSPNVHTLGPALHSPSFL